MLNVFFFATGALFECQVKLMVVVWLISWMHICYILVQYMRVINSSSNWVQYLSSGRSATLAVFQVLNSIHLMWLVVMVSFFHCTAIFTRCSYEVADAGIPQRITVNPWRQQVWIMTPPSESKWWKWVYQLRTLNTLKIMPIYLHFWSNTWLSLNTFVNS